MEAKQFFELVEKMRKAQQLYFRTRTTTALNETRGLEKQVDAEIQRTHDILNGGQYQMQDIFK